MKQMGFLVLSVVGFMSLWSACQQTGAKRQYIKDFNLEKKLHKCSFSAEARDKVLSAKPLKYVSKIIPAEQNSIEALPIGEIYTTSIASEVAYLDRAAIKTFMISEGFDLVEYITASNISGYFAYNSIKDCAILAFSGSDEIRDWYTNSKLAATDVKKGRAHIGFYYAVQSIKDFVYFQLKSHTSDKTTLWITGHSLGAAVSALFAYDIFENGKDLKNTQNTNPVIIDKLVTFGQPMIGNAVLVEYMSTKIPDNYIRLVNENDIITRVPPTNYVHGGKLVWIHEDQLLRPWMPKDNTATSLTGLTSPTADSWSTMPEDLKPDEKEFKDFMNGNFSTRQKAGAGQPHEVFTPEGNFGLPDPRLKMDSFEMHRLYRYIDPVYGAYLQQIQ